jgi:hypothetical protein
LHRRSRRRRLRRVAIVGTETSLHRESSLQRGQHLVKHLLRIAEEHRLFSL